MLRTRLVSSKKVPWVIIFIIQDYVPMTQIWIAEEKTKGIFILAQIQSKNDLCVINVIKLFVGAIYLDNQDLHQKI